MSEFKWSKVLEKAALGALFSLGAAVTAIQATGDLDAKKIGVSLGLAAVGGAVTGAINFFKHK